MERWKKLALVVGILFSLLAALAYVNTAGRRAQAQRPITDISLAQRAEILHQEGLDQPLVVQYGAFLAFAVAGGVLLTGYWFAGRPKLALTRSRPLTALLVLILVVNPVLALLYLVTFDSLSLDVPSMPLWAAPVLIAACLAAYVCGLALWRWKKWGFYGVAAAAVVAFIVNLASSLPWPLTLLGLLSTGLLGLLLYPLWPQME